MFFACFSPNIILYWSNLPITSSPEAQQCAVLWFGEIMHRGLYRKLGFSSINQYARTELKFSKTRTGDFIQLARKLEQLPEVRESVANGQLGYTKAREIVKVASPETAADWVEEARGSSRRELERKVAEARNISANNKAPRGALAGGPPFQVHIHQCPDCGEASVSTGKGKLLVGQDVIERSMCDSQVDEPGKRNTSTIPPAMRRMVLTRDRHKCTTAGCEHTRFLEVHHLKPRALGGSNHPENLITLCSACHRLWHEKPEAMAAMAGA